MKRPRIPDCVIINADDYTFYWRRPKDGKKDMLTKAAADCGEKDDESRTLSFTCALDGRSPPRGGRITNARILAASCFQGKYWSVTARSKKRARKRAKKQSKRKLGDYPRASKPDNALFSIENICEELGSLLFGKRGQDREPSPHGAIIITGATASAKSQITLRLIHDHLVRCVDNYRAGKTRKPHLLTVEDPIEEWFLPGTSNKTFSGVSAAYWPIDYTPRQLRVDVENVSKALEDALRQTPAAVYVSEIRVKDDWQTLMNFAGTGHLIFTTGHAGSLTEAMSKILKALEAKTPADRAAVAETIHALVHLRRENLKFKGERYTALLPALWRKKGHGKQSFISDGLSALSPQAREGKTDRMSSLVSANGRAGAVSRAREGKDRMSSFGRLYFAENLIRKHDTEKGLGETALRKALELDLEGR